MRDDLCGLAGIPGLEPRYAESESAVLPLNYIPSRESYYKTACEKNQVFFLISPKAALPHVRSLYQQRHVLGQGRTPLHIFARARMNKAQSGRM